jgi:drug/metabolite transporter (DMT)-like permease
MIVFILTSLTLIAFAANSLLCRLALGGGLIDPVSFTTIRLASGALALIPISSLAVAAKMPTPTNGSWLSGFALFAYAGAFSLAYVSLSVGVGSLILFGSVQATMIGAALKSGETLRFSQWFGFVAAIGGFIYLVLPGISAPDPIGALLMCLAGIAWGVYSIRGKDVSAPIRMTAGNFLRAAPMALVISAVALSSLQLQMAGVLLALLSGTITSGLGYVLWYRVLKSITTTQASVAQLLTPALAAFGGVLFLSEQLSARLIIASALIVGGVAVIMLKRRPKEESKKWK